MSGFPGQGYYGGANHHGGGGGFSNGGPGPGYGYGNYGPGPSGPPGPPPPGYGDNYGPGPPGPPGPPPSGYGGNYGPAPGGYGPPPPGPRPNWAPGGGSYHRPPPQRPPPPGLDAYGYPMQGGSYAYHARAGPPPPSAPQQFGHGAPQGYTFQYSNCTGRRKALLIGINYFGQKGELRGCINVHNVSNFLSTQSCARPKTTLFAPCSGSSRTLSPTTLFLHYSGHDGQTEDLDGDEDDGYDEVIYPVDHQQNGHIVDDYIHALVVKPLRPGVRLTAIFDSCHSATAMDLPYVYSTKGVLKESNLAKEAGQGLLSALGSYARGDLGGVASTIFGFSKTAYRGDGANRKTKDTRTSPADVIMWSGSRDDQTSADATINAQATGAMSWAFITAIKQNPKQSYVELLNSIRDVLATKYSQKPQLSCSHPLDTNLLFVM